MLQHLGKLAARFRNGDLSVLIAVLILTGGVLTFVTIADSVVTGRSRSWDERLLRDLRDPADPAVPIGPQWLRSTARAVTVLGGRNVLALVSAAVLGFLLIQRANHAVLLVLAATLGGWLLSSTLKERFERPRPEVVPHLTAGPARGMSFPSGHSMMSAVVYLTLGAFLARLVGRQAFKFSLVGAALLVPFLVGLSRVYLGVHYPTDVLAGWCAGLSWAVVCWLTARFLQRRGAVEKAAVPE